MGKHGISLKGTLDFAGVTALLGDLVRSFGERTVCLQQGSEYCTLKPGETIRFEIEAERKKNRQKLSVELSWMDAVPAQETGVVKITSVEPEPLPEPEALIEAATRTPAGQPCPVVPEAAKKDGESGAGRKAKK